MVFLPSKHNCHSPATVSADCKSRRHKSPLDDLKPNSSTTKTSPTIASFHLSGTPADYKSLQPQSQLALSSNLIRYWSDTEVRSGSHGQAAAIRGLASVQSQRLDGVSRYDASVRTVRFGPIPGDRQ
ncbi:unnamed protein product [Linum trigynum]|uniref:Uncharacterized protein n=1 Tax=Linum trigynum TaxID=586398 RepID=A0AAV2FQL3_9ROSI